MQSCITGEQTSKKQQTHVQIIWIIVCSYAYHSKEFYNDEGDDHREYTLTTENQTGT